MQVVVRLLQKRNEVNTSRIFTEELTDEAMNHFQGYKYAPQFTNFIFHATSRLTYKSLQLMIPIFPNIKFLFLDNFWNLDSKSAEILTQFKELQELGFGPSCVKSECFNKLSECPKLAKLVIKKCTSLDKLSEMKGVHTLFIKKCLKLSPNVHSFLSKQNFPSLKNLSLVHMEINDTQLVEICSNFRDQIEELCLSRCKQLTEKGIKSVSKMTKLRRFEGRELANFQDIEMEWPSSLQEIDLRKCRNVGDSVFKSLTENNLQKIDIEESGTSDIGLIFLLENSWEKVKCLRIKSCDNISKKMKEMLLKKCVKLEEISISGIDSELFSKFKKLKQIVTLRLYESSLSHSQFQRLFDKAKNLAELKLFNCNVDDKVLKMMAILCKNILRLAIGDKKVTDRGAQYVKRLHPNLKCLNISGCSSLTEEGLAKMLEEAKIQKFKAYGCNLLGPSTFDILAEKCGFYLHKIECILLGGISHSPPNPTFYFPLLERLKVNLYNDGRLIQSLVRLKRLRKVVFLDTQCDQQDMALFRESNSIEHFEATNGSIVKICENPRFLREWSEGNICQSLRFLVLPYSKMSEMSLSNLPHFRNLVSTGHNEEATKLGQLKHHSRQYGRRASLKPASGYALEEQEERDLENKVGVVMRANYELQTELVWKLHRRGCKVFAFYEEKEVREDFKKLLQRIEDNGLRHQIVTIPYVPSEEISVQNSVKEAMEKHKLERVDVLFTGSFGMTVEASENDHHLQTVSTKTINKHLPNMLFSELFVFQSFEELVNKNKEARVIVLSNRITSISDNFSARQYTLRMCGTALHQLSKNVSIEWKRKSDAKVVIASLGLIQTARYKQMESSLSTSLVQSASVGAKRALHIMDNIKDDHNGKMVDYNLKIINS